MEFYGYGVIQISAEIKPVDLKKVLPLFKSLKNEDNCRPKGSIDVLIGLCCISPCNKRICWAFTVAK